MSGARELLCQLEGVPWGIVTSCTRELALRRIRACGIPEPVVLITADEVEHGKPHPEGYLRGVAALGLPAGECVAFEDAPAGIDAAVAAGLIVVGVASSHEVTALENAHLWLDNLAELRARSRQASESDNEPPRVALVHRLADPKSA